MERRHFLYTLGGAAGALLVGDAALEAYERLTHTRKSFPSAPLREGVLMLHENELALIVAKCQTGLNTCAVGELVRWRAYAGNRLLMRDGKLLRLDPWYPRVLSPNQVRG